MSIINIVGKLKTFTKNYGMVIYENIINKNYSYSEDIPAVGIVMEKFNIIKNMGIY